MLLDYEFLERTRELSMGDLWHGQYRYILIGRRTIHFAATSSMLYDRCVSRYKIDGCAIDSLGLMDQSRLYGWCMSAACEAALFMSRFKERFPGGPSWMDNPHSYIPKQLTAAFAYNTQLWFVYKVARAAIFKRLTVRIELHRGGWHKYSHCRPARPRRAPSR